MIHQLDSILILVVIFLSTFYLFCVVIFKLT